MPKLPSKIQKAASEAESGGYLLPEGRYLGTLKKIDERPAPSSDKDPSWSFEFSDLRNSDGAKKPGRLWVNLPPGQSNARKMREVYGAFG